MIFAFSVLSGYISMRGSFVVHVPMGISMLLFYIPGLFGSLPSDEEMEWATPGGHRWAVFGLIMHAMLACMHIYYAMTYTAFADMRNIKMVT